MLHNFICVICIIINTPFEKEMFQSLEIWLYTTLFVTLRFISVAYKRNVQDCEARLRRRVNVVDIRPIQGIG